MEINIKNLFDNVAKSKGYKDKTSLLMDYGFIPTVRTPQHKRIEIVRLLTESIFKAENRQTENKEEEGDEELWITK